MLSNEKVCPTCQKTFFPECSVYRRTFCGDQEICQPPDEKLDYPDCRAYEFCSSECMDSYSDKVPECTYIPKWKRFMGQINEAGTKSGIVGSRQHNLCHSYLKGTKIKSNS